MQSIPHLNELNTKFGKKGFTIVGVTNEPSAKVSTFITEKSISYLIAIGDAPEYRTNGIPHAWLVGADGKVAWEGHPSSLAEAKIEEALKTVRLGPYFELPESLKKAEVLLNSQRYADGIKELEKYIKKPKVEADAAKATEALASITGYAKTTLEEVDAKVGEGLYHAALGKLQGLEKSFKGHDIAKQAKDKTKALASDAAHKDEMAIAEDVVKAQAYIDAGGARQAAAILKKVTSNKRYENAKMLKVAEELFEEIKAKL